MLKRKREGTSVSQLLVAPKAEWRVVGKRSFFGAKANGEQQFICLSTINSFSELEDECEKGNSNAEGILPGGKILHVGDSQFRLMDRLFCGKDRRKCTRVIFLVQGLGPWETD